MPSDPIFDTEQLIACVANFADKRALVIGDVILDEYIYGRAERLSREAPIPVLEYTHRELIPGGAANPSANIANLGGQVLQIGVIGSDHFGEQLRHALQQRHIDPAGLVIDPARPTTTKTRIMAQMGLRFPQQMARIDQIERQPINGAIEQNVITMIQRSSSNQHALIASDYMTGLLTPNVVDAIREAGRTVGALLTADAQGQLDKYAGFDLVKCNADEAARYVRHDLPNDAAFAAAGADIVARLGLRGGMLITRGSDGLTLVEANGTVTHIRAPHIEDVFDTVGAGDTALAVVTLARISGATLPEAAALANIAAGFVVRKVGNYAPSPEELIGAIRAWNR
jgi:rfaE bifunctional protein kinase chain/domain